MKNRNFASVWILSCALVISAALLPVGAHAQAKALVVEEIIARVNNDVITMSDYQKAEEQLREEVAHDCQGCPQEKLFAQFKEQQKDLLRGLIDQSLMVQRAKDMGISVESDVIKRLDDVRKQNGLASLEDLEKAVEGSGLAWEDYKTTIRNGLLTQEVVRREVGSHINIGNDEVKQYYDAHPQEFTRPEQVVLSEIFLSTEGKSPEEIESVQKKAEDLRNRVMKGDDFNEIAKR
jgi:peptidyl-prolyl cis-trans isomerase SurA